MSWLSSLWDDITGKTQAQQQINAINSAQGAANAATDKQLALQEKTNAQQFALLQQMYNQGMASNNMAAQLGLMGSGMSMAGGLADLYNNAALAQANQAQQMPYLQANQALLAASLPQLMAFSGMPGVSVSPNFQPIDYMGIANQALPNLMSNYGRIQPMMQSMYNQALASNPGANTPISLPTGTSPATTAPVAGVTGGVGASGMMPNIPPRNPNAQAIGGNMVMPAQYNQPSSAGFINQPGFDPASVIQQGKPLGYAGATEKDFYSAAFQQGQSQPNLTNPTAAPYDMAGVTGQARTGVQAPALPSSPVNLQDLIQNNPLYQLQMKTGNEAMQRRLSAQGMSNSSDAAWLNAQMQQQTLGNAYQDQYQKTLNMWNMAHGGTPTFSNTYASSMQTAGNTMGNMGGLAKQLEDAASQRSKLSQTFGSDANKLFGDNSAALSRLYGDYGANAAGAFGQLSQVQQPSFMNTVGRLANLYGTFSGFGSNYGASAISKALGG